MVSSGGSDPLRRESDPERDGVAEIVESVSNKGQTARDDATDDLSGRQQPIDGHCPQHTLVAIFDSWVIVARFIAAGESAAM